MREMPRNGKLQEYIRKGHELKEKANEDKEEKTNRKTMKIYIWKTQVERKGREYYTMGNSNKSVIR